MDGEVGIESEPGVGSTFWFTARLAHGHGVIQVTPSAPVVDVEAALRSHYTGSRILLVEDNDINREVDNMAIIGNDMLNLSQGIHQDCRNLRTLVKQLRHSV